MVLENGFVVKQARELCILYFLFFLYRIFLEGKYSHYMPIKILSKNVSFYLIQYISDLTIELPFPIPITDVIPLW